MQISTFWGSITLLFVSYISVFTASQTLSQNADLTRTVPLASLNKVHYPLPEYPVRGLSLKIPSYPVSPATRLTFMGSGQNVSYRIAQPTAHEVADFYVSKLPSYGWKQMTTDELLFSNNHGAALRIETTPIAPERILVTYRVAAIPNGTILGDKIQRHDYLRTLLAQADTTQQSATDPAGSTTPPPPLPNPDGILFQSFPLDSSQPPPSGPYGTFPYNPLQNEQRPPEGYYPPPQDSYQPPSQGAPSGYGPTPGPGKFPGQGMTQGQFPGQGRTNSLFPGQGPQGQDDQFSSEQQEQFETEMQERQLADIQRGLGQFVSQATRMKKEMASVEKRLTRMCPDMSLPLELKNALAAAGHLADQIKTVEDLETAESLIIDIQDAGMTMQEWGQQIPDLFRLCQGRKQMKNDLKQIESRLKKLQARVARAKNKNDFAQIVSDATTAVAELKTESTTATTLAASDQDAAIAAFEGFFEKRIDVEEQLRALETVLSMSQGIKNAKQDIKKYESTIKRLSKKHDTTELNEILSRAKEKLAELETAIREKEDSETLAFLVDELFELKSEFGDALAELTGHYEFGPQINVKEKVFNFELNDAFKRPMEQAPNEFGPPMEGQFGPPGGPMIQQPTF